MESATTDTGERNQRLTWLAAGTVAAESAGLVAASVLLAWETISATPESVAGAILLAAMAALLAVGLGVCAAGILRHAPWVRGPVLTWQLIQGGVAMRLIVLVAWWVGAPLLAAAIVAGVLVAGPWVLAPRDRSF